MKLPFQRPGGWSAFSRLLPGTWDIALAAAREVFDESAYARFLERESVPSTRENYAAFLREQQAQRARRPRCC
jgi:hypothetical protein